MDGKTVGVKGMPREFGRGQDMENLASHIKNIDLNPLSDRNMGGTGKQKNIDSLCLEHRHGKADDHVKRKYGGNYTS